MIKKVLLGGLLPFISNPVVLAVVGIGAVGLTVYEMLSDKEKEQGNGSKTVPDGSAPSVEPLNGDDSTVAATVNEPFGAVEGTVERTANSTVEEPSTIKFFENGNTTSQQEKTISEEDLKKEVIRQAMSELGKRSAAARARKKTAKG
jgi:hypothetical protein